VIDGDTIVLGNGALVRLVQIDTPEVYFGLECFGRAASAETKRLLPVGTRVLLYAEPATDRIDEYRRLLRYVVRARDGVDVNVRLVAVGAAAPYFYRGPAAQQTTTRTRRTARRGGRETRATRAGGPPGRSGLRGSRRRPAPTHRTAAARAASSTDRRP
jgi:endonuclease YncB( thermonuclease family)